MATNPYASPESGRASATEDDAITPRMIALMGEARWWTMVLALLSLLMSGFLALGAVLALVGSVNSPARMGFFELAILGVLILFFGVPAILLFLSSQKLAVFVASGRGSDLVSALAMQRTLWLVLGLLGMLWGTLTTIRLVVSFFVIDGTIDGGM